MSAEKKASAGKLCGGRMTAPATGERKETLSYCEYCKKYFSRVYREKKAKGPE